MKDFETDTGSAGIHVCRETVWGVMIVVFDLSANGHGRHMSFHIRNAIPQVIHL